ncbi:MAG: hypothetical protein AAFX99_35940, partial [Myxococcota bacterium]
DTLRSALQEACRNTAQTRPAMAEMIRVGNDALLALSQGGLEGLQSWAEGYMARRQAMREALCDLFIQTLDAQGHRSVLTHSNSSTVRLMLARAIEAGLITRVWCTLSHPPGEGRMTARHLMGLGAQVRLISDPAVERAVLDVDMILTGADALQTLGVVNKVGTGILALLGLQHSRPIYCASTSLKLLPPSLQRLYSSENGSSTELIDAEANAQLSDRGGDLEIHNPYYERIDYDMFTGIYTELGLHEPEALPTMARAVEVAEGFGW